MGYEVAWHSTVKADLKALGKPDARRVIDKVKNHLADDPAASGRPLKGIFKGLYRYRVGDYRVIYTVDHAERKLLILHVRHRKDVYREQPPAT